MDRSSWKVDDGHSSLHFWDPGFPHRNQLQISVSNVRYREIKVLRFYNHIFLWSYVFPLVSLRKGAASHGTTRPAASLSKVSLCWLHIPQPLPGGSCLPSHKFPNSTQKQQDVLKNHATASSHHLCHWLLQCPGWKEINPPAKPEFSSRFGHWMSSPRGAIKCQLVREEHRAWSIPVVALSDQLTLTSDFCLRPPSHTI